MKSIPSRWVVFSTLLTLTLLLPLGVIIYNALGAQSETLAHLKQTVLNRYITNTLLLLCGVGILSFLFGTLGAYFVTFYRFRFAKFFSVVLVLPFLIPSYILGFIYSDLLGFFGPVHMFLQGLGITWYFDVLQMPTVVILLSLALYPYVYLIVRASFAQNSAALLNPALSLKAGYFRIFYKVILPLSRPAIVGGLSLVMMETISEYGLVKYFGVDTLSTAVFTAWFGLGDIYSAAYISSVAMLIVFALLIIERFNRGSARYKSEAMQQPLQKRRAGPVLSIFIVLFLSIPFLFGFLLPFAWIVKYAWIHAGEVIDREYLQIVLQSFSAAAVSAFAVVLIALILGYSARVFQTPYMRYLLKAATLGYSIPGAVIAVGILMLAGLLDTFFIATFSLDGLVLGGSLVLLCFGYCVRFLAVGLNSVESSFEKVGSGVNKASRSLNKSLLQTLLRIDLPLIRGALFAGFILVFIDILKELPATLILRPFNYETLATKTYELAMNEMVQESAIYALSIVAVSIIPILITLRSYR